MIDSYAFNNTALTSVEIPASVTSVAGYNFGSADVFLKRDGSVKTAYYTPAEVTKPLTIRNVYKGDIKVVIKQGDTLVDSITLSPNIEGKVQLPTKNVKYEILVQRKYNVTYISDGSVYASYEVELGDAVPVPADDPVKRGHTFTGWTPTPPATMPERDLTITATWQINQYTMSFYSEEGVLYRQITQNYDTAFEPPADPSKTGYTFTGWNPTVPQRIPDSDMRFDATWQINQYTISLYSDNVLYKQITQNYDTAVTAPADPIKTGYTFIGWNPTVPAKMPAYNLRIDAKWRVNQYTHTFYVDGALYQTVTQDYGSEILSVPDPIKSGYSFTGWSPEKPVTMPAYSQRHDATWKIKQYTISFYSEGVLYKQITQNYNTDVTAPANPQRTGYTFIGWEPKVPAKMPAYNLRIDAKWKINQYSVTLYVNSSVWKTYKFDYDSVVTVDAPPAKTGYTVVWSPEIPAKMPARNLTSNAVYTINQYTINFYVDDALYHTITQDYDTVITMPTEPVEEDKEFVKWTPDVPARIPAHNMDVRAIFVIFVERADQLPVFREKLLNASTGEIRPGNKLEITFGEKEYVKKYGRYVQSVYAGGTLTEYMVFCASPTESDVDVSLPLLKDGKYFTINWFAERTSDGQIMSLGEQTQATDEYAEITGVNLIGDNYFETLETDNGTYTGNRVDLLSKVFTQSTEDASDWTLLWTFTGIFKTIEEETHVKELNFKEIHISKTGTRTETIITPDSSSWLYHYRFVPELFTLTDFNLFTSDFRAKLLADKTDSTHYIQSVKVNLSDGYEWTIVEKSTDDVTVNVRIFDGEDLYSVMAGIPGSPFEYDTPVKSGYTFDRLDPEIQVYPDKDTDVHAIFTEIPVPEPEPEKVHTLTAIVEGAVYATAKVEELTSTEGLIADPIVPGKRFTGWSPEIPATMPKNDLTVTAQFTASGGTFSLTYQIDYSTYKTYQVKAGASVPVQPYPTKALYEFSGWSGVPEVMPEQNVTVTGSFSRKRTEVYPGEAKRRTITYKINHQESDAKNSTSVYRVEYHVAGDAITKLALPVKANYSFSEWSGFPSTDIMPDADVVVTTTQTDEKQLARFYVDSDLHDTTQNVVGEKITLPSTPVKSGYTFRYWANCPTYQPAETVTATAVFVKNE